MKVLRFRVLQIIVMAALHFHATAAWAVTSDDFNAGSLNTGLWTVSDPVGDGTVTTNGTQLLMSVPAGTSHDVWTSGNQALAAYQSVADTAFDLSLKFESVPTSQYQIQGVLVRESATTFLRYDYYSNGSSLYLFRAAFSNGSLAGYNQITVSSAAELHLRVVRDGASFSLYYGTDGVNWSLFDSVSFNISVSDVGPYVGNAGPSPAMTAVVDYFFDTNNPIVPEDGASDSTPPTISNIVTTPASDRIRVQFDTDEQATSEVVVAIPGGAQVGSANGALGNSHDLVVTGLQANTTYDVSITATDGSGNSAAAGPISETTNNQSGDAPLIDVWEGDVQNYGDNGQIQRWINIVGKVTDQDGISSLSYRLNGGSSIALTVGPTDTRVHNGGDFNADISWDDLVSGANYVEITATDTVGTVSVETVTVNKNNGTGPTLPYSVDWNNYSNILQVGQVVDGKWELDPARNGVRTSETGYDRLIALGNMAWQNYEITVEVTVHAVDGDGYAPPSWGPGVGVIARWTGHFDWTGMQPFHGWHPLGALMWVRYGDVAAGANSNYMEIISGTGSQVVQETGKVLPPNTTYIFRVQAETPGSTNRYRFKMWEKGTSEPAAWDAEYDAPVGLGSGSIVLVAHEIDATFGPINVTEIGAGGGPGPDTTPPVISNINAAPGFTSATISWATDESATGVVRYGLTNSFELGSVNVGANTAHTANLSGLTSGQSYFFQIEATDASNNTSTSATQSFTTSSNGGGGGITSDEFNAGGLDTNIWTAADPVGDGTINVGNGALSLSVPSGTSHDIWSGVNDALRVMQTAANEDLEIEVKFDSTPSQQYQLQGVLIEQDANNFIRFDYYHDGTNLNVFSASFAASSPTVRVNAAVPSNAELYLRITRVGNTWTLFTSTDGSNWVERTSFSHAMTVSAVGPFSGNAGPSPAFDTVIDYFRVNGDSGEPDTTPPVISNVSVSTSATGATVSWQTNEVANGSVAYGETAAYEIGSVNSSNGTNHSVTLTGLAASTLHHFQISATDGSGNSAQSGDDTFTTDTPDTTPPVISNIQVTPLATSATIAWSSNENATGVVRFGETLAYELGSVNSAAGLSHSVELTGLASDQLHHYEIELTDTSGNTSTSGDQTFITDTASSGSGLLSDEFTGASLGSLWTTNDVVGDGTVSVSGGAARLAITSAASHDLWTSGNTSLRITQDSSNTDFDVETRFTSVPSAQYQIQGLLFEQDANDFVRFDFYHDGSQLHVFSASFTNGSPTVRRDVVISGVNGELHLNVVRQGDTWSGYYSLDGVNWTLLVSFSHTMTLSRVGPFSGNAGPNPAFEAIVDYFRVN